MFLSYSSRKGGSYEGRRGHGKGFKSYPVEVGKDYEVEITEMIRQGKGLQKSKVLSF